ncbi:hypothetical protein MMC25_003502 [Agyrium rufum]|nr:hypothetical protein [Agyrium rufum]
MSSKLDQSLDQILTSRRQTGRRGGRGRGRAGGPRNAAAPAGGIKKNAPRAAKTAAVAATTKAIAPAGADSKVIVSNLPTDVDEAQVKEYFGKSVGPIRRATLTYGPNGVSRGIATIIFSKPGLANKATELNGLLVDKRPIKIEIVVDPTRAAMATPRGMEDRVSNPRAAPKSAAAAKPAAGSQATRGGGARGRGGRKERNPGRPKKTADELDAEMADYFDPNAPPPNGATNGATNGTVATGGEDIEIS